MGKYEEALERARKGMSIDEIFPELKESEDERIRTRLIALVEAFGQGKYKNEMLTYLERQEEQKPDFIVPKRIRPKFAVGDTVCRPMWSDHTIREMYIDCDDPVYICVNEEGTESHISFSEQDEWERKEQKPAEWSEEDEFFRQQLIVYCENCVQDSLAAKCVDWLKSLHPQPHWKPSEEQMQVLGIAIRCGIQLGTWEEDVLCSLLDDLKNL